jgi:hypothetical protein
MDSNSARAGLPATDQVTASVSPGRQKSKQLRPHNPPKRRRYSTPFQRRPVKLSAGPIFAKV